MQASDVEGCLACELLHGRVSLPGGLIVESSGWRVEHCLGPLGVGTVIVKPVRHVESIKDLSTDEAAALGPMLTRAAAVVTEICNPAQVYVCLWSHAGRRPGHVHFVVQPVTDEVMDRYGGAYGPKLQTAMFTEGESPDISSVEAFAQHARRIWAS